MIIVRLYGGLGNQMFQYAAARRLSLHRGSDVVIDVSEFQYDPTYQCYLNYFCKSQTYASPDDLWWIRRSREKRPLNKLFYRMGGLFRPDRELTFVSEPHFHFAEDILHLPDNVCLDGYWQSERYFVDVADIIRSEFAIRESVTEQSQSLLDRIDSSDSISIHVRRGDYVSNPAAFKIHGLCSIEYYKACIAYLRERVDSPRFFLFSDDPAWVRENLQLHEQMTVVENNPAIEDMRLMSRCKHNIIANSSFSWWGAWLNPKPGKMVLAPRQWFQDASINTTDLYPHSWVAL